MLERIKILLGIHFAGSTLPDLNTVPTAAPVKAQDSGRVITIDKDRRYFGFVEYERAGGARPAKVEGLDKYETGILRERGLNNMEAAISVKRCRTAGYSIKEAAQELRISESYAKKMFAALSTAEQNRQGTAVQ